MDSHTCSICGGPFHKEPTTKSSDEQAAENPSATASKDEETVGTSSTTSTTTYTFGAKRTSGSSLGTSSEDPIIKKSRSSNAEQTAQFVSPRCGHIFHRACLTALLDSGKTHCPVCNVICCKDLIKPVFLSMTETSSSSVSTAEESKEPEKSSEPAKEDSTVEKKDEEQNVSQQPLSDEDKLQLQNQINADLQEQIGQVRAENRVLQTRYDKLHQEYDLDTMSIIAYMEAISKLKSETQELSNKLANKIKELPEKVADCKLLDSSIKVMEEENKKLEEYSKKLEEEEGKIKEQVDKAKDILLKMSNSSITIADLMKDLSENATDEESMDEDGDEMDDEDQNEDSSDDDDGEEEDEEDEDEGDED